MSRAHIIWVIVGLILPFVVPKHVQFYRKDYTYIEEYDAFYKVHWDLSGFSWSSAFNTCYEEGAKLFYPIGDEWTIVKNLTDAMPIAPNTSEIYVGLHDEFKLGEFITIDGKSTDSPLNADEEIISTERCMMMDFVTGQFKVYDCSKGPNPVTPFVCKKVDEESCPTVDHEYKFVKNTKKCYKVNNIPKTWQAAMQTCYMEGGVLAVTETKADVPDWAVQDEQFYFIGVRRMFSSIEFYTVKGNKFKKLYDYNNNNYNNDEIDDRNCGVMKYNKDNQDLRMYVSGCSVLLPFICEMSAN